MGSQMLPVLMANMNNSGGGSCTPCFRYARDDEIFCVTCDKLKQFTICKECGNRVCEYGHSEYENHCVHKFEFKDKPSILKRFFCLKC